MPSATSLKSIQDAKKRLTKFLKTLETVPTDELERTAERIYSEAVAQVPYSTGKLESSIYVRVSRSKTKPGLVCLILVWSQEPLHASMGIITQQFSTKTRTMIIL